MEAKALHDFVASSEDELSFDKGSIVMVIMRARSQPSRAGCFNVRPARFARGVHARSTPARHLLDTRRGWGGMPLPCRAGAIKCRPLSGRALRACV